MFKEKLSINKQPAEIKTDENLSSYHDELELSHE